MCGRYLRKGSKQQIAETFRAGKVFEDPLAPNYNIPPTTFQPIVRLDRDTGERELVLARWGLVPFFAKSLKAFSGFSTFNAKGETVAKMPTFREPFKKRRCIVPIDGFYEWKALDNIPKPKKQPFVIGLKSAKSIALAGLWDAWKDPATDAWLQSFTIITTEANEMMSAVHNRMPVILAERDWERWLTRDDNAPPIDLIRPFDSDAMEMGPCNPNVGNVRNNGPEMLVCPAPDPMPLNSV